MLRVMFDQNWPISHQEQRAAGVIYCSSYKCSSRATCTAANYCEVGAGLGEGGAGGVLHWICAGGAGV